MSNDAAGFIGSIPQHYEQGLGPLIFVDYAADIARRVAAGNPARVLETAAGTGIPVGVITSVGLTHDFHAADRGISIAGIKTNFGAQAIAKSEQGDLIVRSQTGEFLLDAGQSLPP